MGNVSGTIGVHESWKDMVEDYVVKFMSKLNIYNGMEPASNYSAY